MSNVLRCCDCNRLRMNESVEVSESALDTTNLVDSQFPLGGEKGDGLTALDAQLTHHWPANHTVRSIVEEAGQVPS